MRAATALLDAGADPNSGWYESNHRPEPEWESALYGAAGVAHHEGLTRLLLARGADPNDGETPYHAPESYEMGVLRALVESGRLNDESLATILLRKTDWHHEEAIRWLLERGVDPNRMTQWGKTALHNALVSDNSLAIIEVLLEHGADPALLGDSGHGWRGPRLSSVAIAARRGRGDVLDLLEEQIEAVRGDQEAGILEKARCIGFLAGVSLKAIDAGNLAARVEMLESVLRQPNGQNLP